MKRFTTFVLTALLASSAAQAKTALNIVWFTETPIEQPIMEKYGKLYEQANPDVDVQITFIPFNQLTQKLQLMVAGNTPPDVARVVTANISEFSPVALDLAKYTDGEKFLAQFNPLQLPYVKKGNRVIGAPLDITANGLYYNKDCFAAAGVKAPTATQKPWTWAEWRANMEKVTKNSKCRYGISWDYTTHRFSTIFYEAGARYINPQGTKFVAGSPEGVKALTFFKGLIDDGLLPKSNWLSGEDPAGLFKSGTTAMYMSGNFNLTNLSTITSFKWGVMPLPKDKIRATNPGGKFIMGFEKSKNPEEAAKFIQWLTSKEVNLPFSKDNLVMSARKDGKTLKYGQFDDEIKVFQQDLSITPSYIVKDWVSPAMAKVNTFAREQIVKALLGQQTPQQALDAISAEGNKYLK